jgi:hypothetical protein
VAMRNDEREKKRTTDVSFLHVFCTASILF